MNDVICFTPSLLQPTTPFSIGHLMGQTLRAIVPRAWFCWISRGIIQLQSVLRPYKWSYWTKISDEMYLGAMPLKNWDHVNKINELGIKAILSINEDYEFQDQLFANPVKANDWKERDIKWLKISSPDLEPIKVSKLSKAVNYVVQQTNLGNPVYIHCTAGRGRSASVAICSLMQIKGYSLEKSIKRIQQCRPQVILSQKQMKAIYEYNFSRNKESV